MSDRTLAPAPFRLRIVATAILSLSAIGSAQAAEVGEIEGRVQNLGDHRPVAGLAVHLKESGASTSTDAQGHYSFKGLANGVYTLRVQVDGAAPTERVVTLKRDAGATQDLEVGVSMLEAVVIDAQRISVAVARAAQQEAPNLINLTTAEEIRKLPDVNAAEAIRRVPGISLETDTGEGRFINIRGIDSDLNSTTFGGLRLPPSNNASPFGGGRAVAMDTMPVGFIGAITVTKTNLPEQDAEALGGTIEITPKTAPRNGAPFAEGHVGTGYEALRHSGIADLSLTAGGRFGAGGQGEGGSYSDRPFSVVVTAAYYEDKRGIDDIEAGYVDNQPTTPDKAFSGFEQRFYRYHRQRHGYGLDLGYQPDADSKYYLRAYDAGYTETVNRQRLTWNFDGNAVVPAGMPNSLSDTVTSGGWDKTLRDEKERIDNKVLALGGSHQFGDKTLDFRLGYTQGSYNKLYDLNSDFNYTPAAGTVVYDNTSNPNIPTFTSSTPYTDPSLYTLAGFRNSVQHIKDGENSLAVNLKMPEQWFHTEEEVLKLGLSARLRHRLADGQGYSFTGFPAIGLNTAITGGPVTFYDGHYQNLANIDANVLRALFDNGNKYETISTSDQRNALLQYNDAHEDVYAAYGQYQSVQGPLTLTGGLRVEATRSRNTSNGVATDANGNITTVQPVTLSKDYNNLFPSLQARYELEGGAIARAAFSSTIARPGFNQITASTNVQPSAGFVSQGNPDLKPTTAHNIDLSVEKYLGAGGIVSAGFFYKQLDNYIVNIETAKTFPNNGLFAGFIGPAHLITYGNVNNAHAGGLELNAEERLRQLPGWLSGFGLGMNYTYVDSSFEIRPGEKAALPSTSKHTLNASAFYERDGLNLRLGLYYVARNLWAVGGSAATDVFSEPRLNLDFGASYALDKHLSLYLNAKNLNNNPLKFTEGSANRPIQREFYGATYQAGLQFNY
jgi:TonB-dependent receptor